MADLDTSIPRLSVATLGSARIGTAKFSYDRRRLRPRIVHLGLGACFRAHGALSTEGVRAGRAHGDAPASAIGLNTAALARRKAAGWAPFTVATCDTLPNHGVLLARL